MREKPFHAVLFQKTQLALCRATDKDWSSGVSEVIKSKQFSEDALGIDETKKALFGCSSTDFNSGVYLLEIIYRLSFVKLNGT